jgi:transcriptional regulator GlxA family with amidase domain
MDFRVKHAIDLISKDLTRPLVLEDVARAVNLSTPHLRSLFSAETGMTPARYLKSLRMQKAEELLRTTFLSVKQVMFQVGIDEKSHFARVFRQAYGQSPAEYRRRVRG